MEAVEVGFYLFTACAFAALLQHPASVVRQFISSGLGRRALMGLGMGVTVIAIVTSPWGKRSGGHFNPAITLAFCNLLGGLLQRFLIVSDKLSDPFGGEIVVDVKTLPCLMQIDRFVRYRL